LDRPPPRFSTAIHKEFEKEEGWKPVHRIPSPNNPFQRKSRIEIRQMERGEERVVLCLSEERKGKDRGIRKKKEKLLLADLKKLSQRIEKGRLKQPKKIHEAIGRLKERHPRVARYYDIEYDEELGELDWNEDEEKKKKAACLDGGYLLKTNRKKLGDEEIWKVYSLLTRVENAFRSMKSPLAERPIFHHLERRVDTHIFLCVLAYHLLVAIETTLQNEGIYTSWDTVRTTLSTHHVATVVLPTADGEQDLNPKNKYSRSGGEKLVHVVGSPPSHHETFQNPDAKRTFGIVTEFSRK
jgi:hypothetical protein